MANTVPVLSYANTFGDWVVTTNDLTNEVNSIGYGNYIKPTGTLYLNDPNLGLQVANNSVFQGQLQVTGVGSSAYVQNNLTVDGQIYFRNASLGLINYANSEFGGTIYANGSGYGITVANNLYVNANTISNTITTNVSTFGTSSIGSANIGNLLVTNTLYANNVPISYFNNLVTYGQLSAEGTFVINGTTIYSTNTFTINANSTIGQISSFQVNRGTSGNNAIIRWNEPSYYWDILDVNNGNYYRILTNEYLSDSTNLNSSSNVASSASVYNLQNELTANVNSLQSQISSNVSSINTSISYVNQYAQTAFSRANTSSNSFVGTSGTAYPSTGTIVLNSGNGVTVTGSGNTLTLNTPQDLRSSASPNFNNLTINGSQVLNASNFNSYAPTLTGTGASGTWSINITGNAATTSQTNFGALSVNGTSVVTNNGGTWGINITGNSNGMGSETFHDVSSGELTYILESNGGGTGFYMVPSSTYPTATGSRASGTWGINITGNAASVTNGVYNNGGTYSINITGNAGTASGQAVGTGNNVQFNSLGIGTGPSGTTGEIRATNNITAYYSDDRLKTKLGNIENALDKLMSLNGFYYQANETAQQLGYKVKKEIGVSAQEVQKILPEIVVPAPINENYLTVYYDRLLPLVIEAIKELKQEMDIMKSENR